ncbi:hypothetical protein [Paenibacillus arenosi]|uniref:Uncharacterized protein n=1 Tax=Paenibacillus arenosi TaxID=2774142 RepID=A0ABR9B4B0_9BACL|nr:hypothetical protein [Paenibacillus arenosi]MBD8501223.1 hypothetical protein [Paenibacillus arenosi]
MQRTPGSSTTTRSRSQSSSGSTGATSSSSTTRTASSARSSTSSSGRSVMGRNQPSGYATSSSNRQTKGSYTSGSTRHTQTPSSSRSANHNSYRSGSSGQSSRAAQSRSGRGYSNEDRYSQGNRGSAEGVDARRDGNHDEFVMPCFKCKSKQFKQVKKGYQFKWMGLALVLLLFAPFIIVRQLPHGILFFANLYMDSGINAAYYIMELLVSLRELIEVLMYISILLSLPVSIGVGFIGSNKVVQSCLRCGNKRASLAT